FHRGAQVPRPSAAVRGPLGDRPEEPGSRQGPGPSDHPAEPRGERRADDLRTELVPDRMGDVLPPRGVQDPPDRAGRVDSTEIALRAVEAMQADEDPSRLLPEPRRVRTVRLADGAVGEGLVAPGGQPRCEPGDGPALV